MNRDIGERKEKIETKGAYSHDLHEAIRDVRRSFANADFERIGSCLNALLDICAPEIREAINGEWGGIDKKYRPMRERVRNAEYEVRTEWEYESYKRRRKGWSDFNGNWETEKDGSVRYHIITDAEVKTRTGRKRLVQQTRNKLLREVWSEIYHERFKACIDCLDRHGELRKWREVEYGKL